MDHNEITREIIGENAIDDAVAFSTEVVGKECIGCLRAWPYSMFRRDSSHRDGRVDLCMSCESVPRLSTVEHTARLRERNDNSEAVKRQRWPDQAELKDEAARLGRRMAHTEFIRRVRKLVPSLYITDGRFVGDLAVFQTYGQPQPDLDGRTFRYLWYLPTGWLPEYSLYEFDARDVPVREKERGWRTPLLRLILDGLVSKDAVDREFGEARGPASSRWYRSLQAQRRNF